MSQMQRQYLRLEEITEKTRLTQGDVWEAVEQETLSLCANIAASRLGAYDQDEKTIIAIFDYQGMVQLEASVAKAFALSLEPQTCQRMTILQPEWVNQWQTVSAAFPKVTQAGFAYQNQPISPPLHAFLASGKMTASLTQSSLIGHAGETMNAIFSQLSDTLSDSVAEKQKAFAEKYPAKDEERLSIQAITINPTHLRVAVSDLVAVFGEQVLMMAEHGTSQEKGASVRCHVANQPVLTHPIAQIAYRVLESNPNAKANKIWNLIRSEVNQNGAQRVFDTDAIIDEMTLDHVTWFGRGDADNAMQYNSFRMNILPKVRRALNGQ
ncbi:hypothetical protein [Vibrio cincinnatiensis]|uniref:hypothetical protein n=2 Tax=Vibrio cincinnatiensis TaxID=675 RepID=UPI0012ACB49B|nr:hypothetical protein [Vibrio cincinnatiensis]